MNENDAFKHGQQQAAQGKPLGTQGNIPDAIWKPMVAGHNSR